jgi:hypothetical protein
MHDLYELRREPGRRVETLDVAVVADAGDRERDTLVADGCDQRGEVVGVDDVVGWQVRDQRRARHGEPGVAGCAEPPVGFVAEKANARIVAGDEPDGVRDRSRRAVVDDDELPIRKPLRE